MVPVELWFALATFFGATLTLNVYFRTSGTKLETRLNKIIEEKEKIISESYKKVVEEILERFKTTRTLSQEQEDELEDISATRFRLKNLPYDLSKVVDKLTYSFVFGIASVFFIIVFPYTPDLLLDPTLSIWFQVFVGVFMVLSFYRYWSDGLYKIRSLRKIENMVNEIDRSKRFDELNEIFIMYE